MKFKVLQPIWSRRHQGYFEPGTEVDLDITEQEAAAFSGVLQPLEIVEASSKELPKTKKKPAPEPELEPLEKPGEDEEVIHA